MSKARITAVSLALGLLTSVIQIMPAAAAEPHENPDTAPLVYDGTALLQKYSQALDDVPAGNTSGLELLQEEAAVANIPIELKNTVNRFLSSCSALSAQILPLQTDMENARTLLAQYRVDDARNILASADGRLNQAFAALLEMDNTAADTGRWWKVDSSSENSSLKQAYGDVQDKLRRLRQLLDLLDNMNLSLTRQTEAVLAITEGDLAKVEELKGLLAQERADPDVLARLDELKGLLLRPTTLTLYIEPETAFVGDKITIRGVLSSEGRLLPGRIITLLIDNAPISSILTNDAGAFEEETVLPYRYVPQMKVQAVYYPVGNDIGQYLGVSSNIAALHVLFYQGTMNAAQGTPANPGRDFLVTAAFKYDSDAPPLEERRLIVYLDNDMVFNAPVGRAVFLRLPVAANTSMGTHRLSFYALPSGRYAPAGTSLELEVARITPVIAVDAPGIFLLPFSRDIGGRVYSSAGPLQNASVEITLGGWKANAATRGDGSFRTRLDTGFSLMLLGRQEMHVAVAPVEPWYKAHSVGIGVTVINPVNIAGIILILTVPVLVFNPGRKKVRAPAPHSAPSAVPSGVLSTATNPEAANTSGSSPLLTLFKAILIIVQAATAMVLQPYQTLGEFARETGPRLGKFSAYFQEFIRIIERHLYSRRRSADTDGERARELSRTLMTGIKNENS